MGQRAGHPLTEVDMNAVKYLKTIGMPMEDIMGVSCQTECTRKFNYYLWSISHPGRTGIPSHDLSEDNEAAVDVQNGLSPVQLALERVIVKIFNHYNIPLEITDTIRAAFKSKLWRLGKSLAKLGGNKRSQQLQRWKEGNESMWNFMVNEVEVNRQLLKRSHQVEVQLAEEVVKRRKFEKEVKSLRSSNKKQMKIIVKLKTGKSLKCRGSSRKQWTDYSRQQRHQKKKDLVTGIQAALSFCDDCFRPCSVELENIDTGDHEVVDVQSGAFSKPVLSNGNKDDRLYSTLYVKDKYSLSNEAYHELSMLSDDLPRSCQIKALANLLNSQFEIRDAPNGIIGVQQSLKDRVMLRLKHLSDKSENVLNGNKIRIKITGDNTQVARNLNVENIAFTILEEGQIACSAMGNHTVSILKIPEKFEILAAGLEDICAEARDLEVVTVNETVYTVERFLGGDWKFLALVCGLDAANADHACIWCKCPKSKRWNMSLEWSLTDPGKGARTITEIAELAKLGKSSKKRYNCSRSPVFPFIPIDHVIIDSLHLFLRISDVLINLLIRDLRFMDGLEKATSVDLNRTRMTHLSIYECFLNDSCGVSFHWYLSDDKKLKWRNLTGPEKHRVFQKIDIPTLFPSLLKKHELQALWTEFYRLVQELGKIDCDADNFELAAKAWVRSFLTIYQTTDVTPYMHAFAMHVAEFLRLYGSIVMFTQQGLEKLNDITTKQYQRGTNHRKKEEPLRQILEKRN